jgi:hypothetical protein
MKKYINTRKGLIVLAALFLIAFAGYLLVHRHTTDNSATGFRGQCDGRLVGEVDVYANQSVDKASLSALVQKSGIDAKIKYVGRHDYPKESGNPSEQLYILKVAPGSENNMAEYLLNQKSIFDAFAFGQPCPI